MIDLHSHILPGVDDGAQTLEDSLEMARKAISQGITHLMCTPHHNNGKYNNPADKIIREVANLQGELDKRGLDLTLLEGQEVRLTEFLLTAIQRDEILFTDLDNTYLRCPSMRSRSSTSYLIEDRFLSLFTQKETQSFEKNRIDWFLFLKWAH